MRLILFGLFAVAAATTTEARAEDLVLKPDSKWVAHYGENNCRLIRTFGKSDDQTVLIIEQIAPSESFNWTVSGASLARTRWSKDVQVQWGPEFETYEKTFPKASLDKFGPAFIGRNWEDSDEVQAKVKAKELRDLGHAELASGLKPVLAGLDADRAARVGYLTLRQDNRVSLTLMLEDMGAAISSLNNCTRDLATNWGFDESYRDRLTTTPVWLNIRDVAQHIQQNYPTQALSRGAQANFRMRVIVGANGRAERCDWINDTEADDFDMRQTPCDIVMEEAEFEPALDENEEPIRSIYETSIVYRIN